MLELDRRHSIGQYWEPERVPDERSIGRLLELVLMQPRALRQVSFTVAVQSFRPSLPYPPRPGERDPLKHSSRLVLTADGSKAVLERMGNQTQPPQRTVISDGAWWALDVPELIEHLDPGLVLSSLTQFAATFGGGETVLRATPRQQSDLDDAASLVYAWDDVWHGSVDPETGVLLHVVSYRDGAVSFRSELEWMRRPATLPESGIGTNDHMPVGSG